MPNSPGIFTVKIPPQFSGCTFAPFSFLLVTYRVSSLAPPKVQQTGMLTGNSTCGKHDDELPKLFLLFACSLQALLLDGQAVLLVNYEGRFPFS